MKYGCSICEEWKCHDEYPPEADFREGAHEDSLVCPDCVINYDADALRRDRISAFETAVADVAEGWFDPADYCRESLKNHLRSRGAYSDEFLEGYCDGAFDPLSLPRR